MSRAAVIACCLLLAAPGTAGAANNLAYTGDPHWLDRPGTVVLDVRPLADCERASVPGARCLPAGDLLGPHGRLPSFRQIAWLLGTLGLSGRETLVVAGERAQRRDFVAGILYLAGQRRVLILQRPLQAALHAAGLAETPGRPRSLLADPIYQGRPRARLIVWRAELARALTRPHPPLLVDGRGRDAYLGIRIDAYRGGHIPGALSLPADGLSTPQATRPSATTLAGAIAYAEDPMGGIAYFAMLHAGLGAAVKVYPGGWRAWAAHTALPVSDETYVARPRHPTDVAASRSDRALSSSSIGLPLGLLAGVAGGAVAYTALYLTTRKVSWN